jgi:putative ABC transport system permease protein
VLSIFVSESVALSVTGGALGIFVARFVIAVMTHKFIGLGIPLDMKVKLPAAALAFFVSVLLGVVSGYIPAYRASRMDIVEGLRHIG